MEKEESSSSFSTGKSAQEGALPYVPDCYVIPSSHRPDMAPEAAYVPIIDFGRLNEGREQRSMVIKEIGYTCSRLGFFQVSVVPWQQNNKASFFFFLKTWMVSMRNLVQ